MSLKDRAMLGKSDPRTQQALRRLAAATEAYPGQVVPEFLTTAQRIALPDKENHRLVFDTDLSQLFLWTGVAWQQVGSGSGVDELVKVQASDATPGFLISKLVAGANISLTPQNIGGNENILIAGASPSAQVPLLLSTAARLALSPSDGTLVYDIDERKLYVYQADIDYPVWSEV